MIGSETPWVEAILLAVGAKHVTTVEYNRIISTHPQVLGLRHTTHYTVVHIALYTVLHVVLHLVLHILDNKAQTVVFDIVLYRVSCIALHIVPHIVPNTVILIVQH